MPADAWAICAGRSTVPSSLTSGAGAALSASPTKSIMFSLTGPGGGATPLGSSVTTGASVVAVGASGAAVGAAVRRSSASAITSSAAVGAGPGGPNSGMSSHGSFGVYMSDVVGVITGGGAVGVVGVVGGETGAVGVSV